jgi:hypothetical protein
MRSERLMLAFYVVDGCVSCMETSDEVGMVLRFPNQKKMSSMFSVVISLSLIT